VFNQINYRANLSRTGNEFVMGQHGRRQGNSNPSNAKPKTLPPSGSILPDMGSRSEPNTSSAGKLDRETTEAKTGSSICQDSAKDGVKPAITSGSDSEASASAIQSAQPRVVAPQALEAEAFLDRKSTASNDNSLLHPIDLDPKPPRRAENNKKGSITAQSTEGVGFRSVSWSQVTGSYRRERSIEGLLIGAAVGDALGLCRKGLSRRWATSMFGRSELSYKLTPGLGMVSDDTHRMLMTLQAMLRSKSQLENFRNSFASRLRWYLLTGPVTSGIATQVAGLRLWMGVTPELSGVSSSGNSPLISALALATVLQGTGHSVERWVTASTKLTHKSPEVTEAAILIAHASHMALMVPKREFDSCRVLDDLIALTQETSLNKMLQSLREPLAREFSVHRAAKVIGFDRGIPGTALATAVIAVYAWLRHPCNFERAITSAIRAGGDTDSVAALVGGLAGVRLGVDSIPSKWTKQVSTWPQNRRWMERLTGRLTDWPHGSEDLHAAPALPTYPVRQLIRSAGLAFGVAVGTLIKSPWQIATWLDRRSS
jgi:ADP-ribosyl-[dinitrogen reductase] hydrolase